MLVLVHVQYCGVYDLDRQVIRQMLELKLLEPLERKHRACATKSERKNQLETDSLFIFISYYSRTK